MGFLLPQQQDEVIERERAAAASRLCEASERWEAQLQASRMRLAADNDMKVGDYADLIYLGTSAYDSFSEH